MDDKKTKPLCVTLTPILVQWLRDECARYGESPSGVIRRLLIAEMGRRDHGLDPIPELDGWDEN